MLKEFALPDLGEGLTESEVVAWRVAVGDHIGLNQVIADIETAKAVVELPSPYEGTVTALHAAPGDTVEVGAPLLSVEVAGSPVRDVIAPATTQTKASAASATGSPPPDPTLVGYGASTDAAVPLRRARKSGQLPPPPASDGLPERPRSTPPVRTLARELGVDLERLQGTGKGGLITRDDVVAAAPAPPTGETRTPITGVRKATAAAMVASAFTAPQATEFLTLDVTASTKLIARLKAEGRANILALAARAVCLALARNPALGSRWDEESQLIVHTSAVNLGIAVATERGLVVPCIPNAHALPLFELAAAIAELAATARAGRTVPAAMLGGTFTITNIGVFGVHAGTPILAPGQAGILALGAVRRMPWEHRGRVALRDVLTLSLTFDHRVVDGEQAARFLTDVGALLADPARALVMV